MVGEGEGKAEGAKDGGGRGDCPAEQSSSTLTDPSLTILPPQDGPVITTIYIHHNTSTSTSSEDAPPTTTSTMDCIVGPISTVWDIHYDSTTTLGVNETDYVPPYPPLTFPSYCDENPIHGPPGATFSNAPVASSGPADGVIHR